MKLGKMEAEVASEPVDDKHELIQHVSKPDNRTDDSGYSSDVLVSPELNRGFTVPQCLDASIDSFSLIPGIAKKTVERLTSTPHSSSDESLPKIDVLDGVTKRRQIFGVPVLDLSSPLEICELELTCKEDANQLNSVPSKCDQPKLSTEQKTQPVKQTTKQKESLSKLSRKCRKPQYIFARMLKEADYLVVKVLAHLSGQDLLNLSHVNRQLREMILGNKRLNARRVAFINGRRKECENVGKENFKMKMLTEGSSSSSFGTLSPRKALSTIENLQPTSPAKASSTFHVASHTVFESFIEEGQKLPQGEELQKCVKCKSPAMVQKSQQRAVCSRKKCGYDYCIRCHLSSHRRPQDCSVLKPRTRQGNGIFSNKCKRSLRRL
ncbi:F-box only protein 5-like [Panulirus ornatus]|uniref:F-box only protein 5-like n=1 Tax=Panulirus ornatus TaxID=150431 RepID=UPI003A8B0511